MKGVVLFNLGAPPSLDAVEPFLFNLFSDPDVVRLPGPMRLMQRPLARWIAWRRAPESRKNYAQIGGRSPLLENTRKQAAALEAALGPSYCVAIAMRYWQPRSDDAVRWLYERQASPLILLPLYPQYSLATTLSSVNDFRSALAEAGWNPPLRVIESWYERPLFAELVANTIRAALAHCDPAATHVLFSAHGVPLSYVQKYGDPYQRQVEASVQAVVARLSRDVSYSLCYQSRVGPVKWLGPDIADALQLLAADSRKTVLLYPISFVSEHVETLFELDILYADLARSLGLDYRRLPTFGDHPRFIALLADLVHEAEKAA